MDEQIVHKGMILSNFLRTGLIKDKRIRDLTFGEIFEICEILESATLESSNKQRIVNIDKGGSHE